MLLVATLVAIFFVHLSILTHSPPYFTTSYSLCVVDASSSYHTFVSPKILKHHFSVYHTSLTT